MSSFFFLFCKSKHNCNDVFINSRKNQFNNTFFLIYYYKTFSTRKGVDWKSLTIPACLPITTDYFPDKRSLHNDYVISDYTLLPDDVNSDYANSRAIYRKPLTTEEVFTEIVSQRLAQGFQLIVLEEKTNGPPAQAPCCGGLKQQKPVSVLHIQPLNEVTKEYLLSIGRIFHKITLNGSVITVTGYRPR